MFALFFTFLITMSSHAQDCTISTQEEHRLLDLPYQDFDQAMGSGWRYYADKGCDLLAARLLEHYKAKHQADLVSWQSSILTWHAGQMYAIAGDYPNATDRFQTCFNPDETEDSEIRWNDYVHATLAFLSKDMNKIIYHRNRIAEGPSVNGVKLNLAVVDGLIKCFNRPYAEAYSSCR